MPNFEKPFANAPKPLPGFRRFRALSKKKTETGDTRFCFSTG
jgi:hypothetical protein